MTSAGDTPFRESTIDEQEVRLRSIEGCVHRTACLSCDAELGYATILAKAITEETRTKDTTF
jgi:hypothetical protein